MTFTKIIKSKVLGRELHFSSTIHEKSKCKVGYLKLDGEIVYKPRYDNKKFIGWFAVEVRTESGFKRKVNRVYRHMLEQR